MQTTHIGSLPFTSLKMAIEYNNQFDLPVLFSLPGLGKEHFMGFDLAFMLGALEKATDKGTISIKSGSLKNSPELKPFFFEEIFKSLKGREFKYQLIGPYTFYKMLEGSDLSFKDVCECLAPLYLSLVKRLHSYGLTLFSLDEPMLYDLNYKDHDCTDLNLLNLFLEYIKVGKVANTVHVCSDIPVDFVKKIDSKLNLDFSCLTEKLLPYLDQTNILGFSNGLVNLQEFQGAKTSKYLENVYISASCGLYGKSSKDCDRVLNNLKISKQLFVARCVNST